MKRSIALPTPTSEQAIEAFIDYLKIEKCSASTTIEGYRCDLVQLAKFLGDRNIVAAHSQDVAACVGHLLSTVTARSAARKVATFRHFFKSCPWNGSLSRILR
jgi:site-specific recombinase XerD